MNGVLRYIWILCIILPFKIQGRQACNAPLFTLTDSITTQSLRLNWTDFNDEVIGWEIEYGVAGFSPIQIPSKELLTATGYTLSGLEPGTSYDIYIRAVCNESENMVKPFLALTLACLLWSSSSHSLSLIYLPVSSETHNTLVGVKYSFTRLSISSLLVPA